MKVAKEFKNKFKERNGITLIALVITIIVLLILAGISITMLTGDNSILKQGVNAKQRTEETAEEEQVRMATMAAITDATVNLKSEIEKAKLEEELQKYFSGATVTEEDENFIYEGEYKTYTISKSGIVTAEESAISIKLELSYKNETIEKDGIKVGSVVENVPIPVGFTHVSGTQKNTGLVIESNDEYKNQFVWVPVNQNQTLKLTVKTDEQITSIVVVKPDGTEEDITSGGKTQEISMKNNGVYLNGIYVVKVTTANNSKMGQITIRTLYGQDTYTRKFEKNISQTIDQLSQATEKYNTINELLRAKGKNSV